MKKLKNIKIVSVDLFRTLIDIDPTPKTIWQKFLKNNFPDEISRKYCIEPMRFSGEDGMQPN